MIIHAAFLPHSPLLLPNVHPDGREIFAKTSTAIAAVAETLKQLKPDVLCILSGHGDHYAEVFSADLSPAYMTDLRSFGDLSTPQSFRPAPKLLDHLQRHLRRANIPFTLSTNAMLEYGASVALRLLTPPTSSARILPLAFSDLSAKEHFQFGQSLAEELDAAPERIAILSVGDLSHCLSGNSPTGFCKEGAKFDQAMVQAVSKRSSSALLSLSQKLVKGAQESGYKPMLMLFGTLEKKPFASEMLSYEAPLGVGWLVAQFTL